MRAWEGGDQLAGLERGLLKTPDKRCEVGS